MAPDDPREFWLPDPCLPEWIEAEEVGFAIDTAAVTVPETAQREPVLDAGPVMVGFGDDEDDAEDSALAEPSQAATSRRRRYWTWGVAGSVGVHLLPLLFVLYWEAPSARIERPIPVMLVLEAPRPELDKPKPETKPPPGRLASADLGDPTAKANKPTVAERPLDRPQKTQVAAAVPTRRAPSPPELVSALPKPAPMPEPMPEQGPKLLEAVVRPAAPKPAAPVKPPVMHEAMVQPQSQPRPERAWGRIPGPNATQDEYLAYANALIRHNQEMIPPSLLRGRNGAAVISILVLADGTIAQIAIKESSGYPEIDQRAERMVAAVKRFPPLPQWFKGPSMILSYHMLFGDRMMTP